MKKWSLILILSLFAQTVLAQATGALQVFGEPGRFQIFQKVKAVRCDMSQRGVCAAAVFFDLNKPQAVPVGDYLVGFENSIYPSIVKVTAGQTTTLKLEKLSVPSGVRGQKIRVYRDFNATIEQQKIFLSMYYMKRHFFRLNDSNFGDLYLTGSWDRDFVQRFTYETCDRIESYPKSSLSAKGLCAGWNKAKDPGQLRELFSFGTDGTFTEMWVTYPGDVFPAKHPRYLVSAPLTETDFVAVFPGAYRFVSESKNAKSVGARAGVQENETIQGISLNVDSSLSSLEEDQ